jgi:hypothetical protein
MSDLCRVVTMEITAFWNVMRYSRAYSYQWYSEILVPTDHTAKCHILIPFRYTQHIPQNTGITLLNDT